MKIHGYAALLFALMLSACGDGRKEGGGSAPNPEKLSPATLCLRQHPLLRVRSFPSAARAAGAFFRATVDCEPSEAEVSDFADWLEARGVTIKEEGAGQ